MDRFLREVHYLCCFKNYVEEFEKEQRRLEAQRKRLDKDIEVAKRRNESRIEDRVQHWLYEADSLIQQDTEETKKWFFGLCTNCIWQYKRGKELERKTRDIVVLRERSEFNRLVHVKNYSSLNFIHFESRKPIFEHLKEALEGDSILMIGLVGMEGVGKTTMAKEVGKEVEKSKVFDKVIFIVVSYSANVRKIQAGIARQLGLTLEEGMGSVERAARVLNRIANSGEKILIILDDVWEELDLTDIGIPLGHHHKNCCSILLTTRDEYTCHRMGCQEIFHLKDLANEEAWTLFQLYAGINSGDYYFHSKKEVALQYLEECRGLPILIVAVAKALNPKPLGDWKKALIRLQHGRYENNLDRIGNLLKLSYDYLDNEEAKLVFLLCSLFPYDFEIPTELLCRVAIGLGLCGEVDKYHTARSQMLAIKDQLIDSSLLLKAEEECVKMHNLVREAALRIGNKEIQVIKDFDWTTSKENILYSSWEIDGFPGHFDGAKLEILLVWINAYRYVRAPYALFAGMMRLRVLFLMCTSESLPTLPPPLLQSIRSLRNIRTLVLTNWELRDISIMGSVPSLETLELNNCSITELPNELEELYKLRLLGLRHCEIRRHNPFRVIQRCPQLEELYYVENRDIILYRGIRDEELAQITIPRALQRYHIIGSQFPNSLQVDATTSRCFKPGYLKEIFSEATFKSLAASSEILEFGCRYEKAGWRNLVPDIVPMEDGGMEDLIRLSLYDWYDIECLIDTELIDARLRQRRHYGLFRFDVTIFSKLAELKLCNVAVKELCRGPLPIDFLRQLEELDLKKCLKLESTLFKGNLDLGMLKSIKLKHCSVTSLFYPSTIQSLQQLEALSICKCYQLQYIIMYEGSGEEIVDDYDRHGRTDGSIFPKLKCLHVKSCDDLKFVLPISLVEGLPLLEEMRIVACRRLKYIFGQHPDEEGLYQMENEIILPSLEVMEISGMPDFIYIFPAECYHPMSSNMQKSSQKSTRDRYPSLTNTFSWAPLRCFLPKSSAKSIDRTDSRELKTEVFNPTECFLRPPLDPRNMREIKITHCSNFTWLSTLSFALSMSLLEKLQVGECHGLKHILADDEDSHDDPNYGNIFSNLQEFSVWNCDLLESSVQASIFRNPDHVNISKSFKISIVQCLLTRPLHLRYMRNLKITHCSNFTTLLTLSIASSMSLLKEIHVGECHELKHIFTNDLDDDDHNNYSSIFPSLQEVSVWNCGLLESLFPASHLNTLYHLKSLRISGTPMLKYVLGKCDCDDNLPQHSQPAQESRQDIPNMSEQEVDEEELEMQKQASSSPPTEDTKPSANKMVEQVPISDLPAMATPSSSSDLLEIKETEDPSIEDAPKLGKAVIANEIMESELSKASAAPFVMPLQNESPQNNEVSNQEGPSSHKYNKETSSTHSESDISHPGSLSFDKINSHSVLKNPQTVTSDTHIEAGSPHPNPSSPQSQIMVKQLSPQQFGYDDLDRLFRLMENGADIGVCMSHVSKIADNEVAMAFADLEASLKMSLQEIASSDENSLRLENALNFLSTHYSEDGDPPYGLKSTIQSLHQEIPSILSSFKQVSASKEKDIKDCEIKLSFLQEQRKKSVSETIEFLEEFEVVKKEMSKIEKDNLKERQELEKWSSCVSKWWKATLL